MIFYYIRFLLFAKLLRFYRKVSQPQGFAEDFSFVCEPLFSSFCLPEVLPTADVWQSLSIFFAAEDEGRTEEPTDRRKQKEREKGRVAKTQEIPSSLVALGGFLAVFFSSAWILSGLTALIKNSLSNFSDIPALTLGEINPLLTGILAKLLWFLWPIFSIAIIMAVVGNIAQVGFLFTLEPLKMDLSKLKIDPGSILKKVFFSRQIFVNLIKTLIRVTILLWASYLIISADFLSLTGTVNIDLPDSLRILGMSAFKLALVLSVILLVLAIPDYFYQRFEFLESIKMTREEVKQEFRETEGDPYVKQEQRRRAMEFMRRNILANVQQSDVVITNPTHYAVALRYDVDKEEAPRVMAKGEDSLALLIRRLAKEHGIEIIENKPLARTLYQNVQEDQVVPPQFYQVLLEIFANIDKVKEKLTKRKVQA